MGPDIEHQEVSVIRQIVMGRRELLGDLINPHLEILRRFVYLKMGNDPDIEDVVQQTVFKAFTHLEQFRFQACFRTWLIRIALNEVAQHLRKRQSGRWIGLDASAATTIQVKDPGESALHSCERRQATKLLHRAIGRLPETYRIVVRMRDLEELSISEVADALCLTIGAVKSRHRRGRLMMAKFMRAQDRLRGRSIGRGR
jgi:RNA polymerase sigma-70 factor (ECF subfamily)